MRQTFEQRVAVDEKRLGGFRGIQAVIQVGSKRFDISTAGFLIVLGNLPDAGEIRVSGAHFMGQGRQPGQVAEAVKTPDSPAFTQSNPGLKACMDSR